MQYNLSQKDFKQFKQYCLNYQKKYGLTEWILSFTFISDNANFATIEWNYFSKKAIIRLSKQWNLDNEINVKEQLKQTAEHEILHLLISKLRDMAYDRNINEQDYETTEHEVINRLLQKG